MSNRLFDRHWSCRRTRPVALTRDEIELLIKMLYEETSSSRVSNPPWDKRDRDLWSALYALEGKSEASR